jgi:Dyp-type peroxidase family
MSSTTDVDFDDVQGLVRYAHAQLQGSAFLLLGVTDADAARRWLAAAPITTAAARSPPPDRAMQVAFSAPGLAALGLDREIIAQFAVEYVDGLVGDANRARRLGDTGSNDPARWQWGGERAHAPHVLLMLYAQPERLDALLATTRDTLFGQAFAVHAELISRSTGPKEPFGFVDGISQPLVDWQQVGRSGSLQRDSYSNRVALGEILLGYRNEYGQYNGRPLLDPEVCRAAAGLPDAEEQSALKDLGRNGSYLVFRQLAQDVRGFWRFLDQAAGGDPAERERLAAAMVGRHRDGSPLTDASTQPIDGSDPDNALNHFTYAEDPFGQRCPIGAHVRRANPRTGDFPPGVTGPITRLIRLFGFGRRHRGDDLVASTRFHRLLRRGRVYGPELTPDQALAPTVGAADAEEERGLHFICLCGNLSRQFEFVQGAWAMNPKFAGLPTESDPLLGNRQPLLSGEPTDGFTMPQPGAPARRQHGLPEFVVVRGGAYFFMPGIRALRFIVGA